MWFTYGFGFLFLVNLGVIFVFVLWAFYILSAFLLPYDFFCVRVMAHSFHNFVVLDIFGAFFAFLVHICLFYNICLFYW